MPSLKFYSCVTKTGAILDEKHFCGLNSEQQKVVSEVEKPLLIKAGAGSGKTLTVASKIAYLVQKEVKTENILALWLPLR